MAYPLKGQKNNCIHTISGIVIDSAHQTRLSLTGIEVVGSKQKAETNDTGYFTLGNICSGEIELHFSHIQCEHIHLKLFVSSDTFIKVYIKHEEHNLRGIAVEGKSKPNTLNALGPESIRKYSGQSIAGIMQEIAGISMLKTGFNVGKPMINGLHSNRVILINNGIRQEGQNWGLEHAPEIDAFLITEIENIKGPAALRHASDGIGGVVTLKAADFFATYKTKALYGEINTMGGSNGRSRVISGIIGSKHIAKLPIYWRLQGTLKGSGNVRTSNDYIANTGSRETNYSLGLGHKTNTNQIEFFFSRFENKNGIYQGSQSGNLSDLEKAMSSTRPLIQSSFQYRIDRPYQAVTHHLIKLSDKLNLNSKNSIELTLAIQDNHRTEYDVLRTSTAYKGPVFDYYIRTYFTELLWRRFRYHGAEIQAGLSGNRQANAYTGRYFIPGFYQNTWSAFGWVQKEFHQLKTETSLRFEQKHLQTYLWKGNTLNTNDRNFMGLVYSFMLTYSFNKQNRMSFIHGSSWRPPAPNELYSNGLHQGLASIEIGDSALKPERSFHQGLEGHFKIGSIEIDAEVYSKYIQSYINLIPSGQAILTIRGAYPAFRYSSSNALINGLNLNMNYKVDKVHSIDVKAQFINGTNLNAHQYLNQMPPYKFKLNLNRTKNKYSFSINCSYTLRQFRYVDSSDYMPPPPAYFLLGADFEWKPKIKQRTIHFQLGASNLFNQTYRDYLNRMRYFYGEPGTNVYIKLRVPLEIQTN